MVLIVGAGLALQRDVDEQLAQWWNIKPGSESVRRAFDRGVALFSINQWPSAHSPTMMVGGTFSIDKNIPEQATYTNISS